MKPQPHPSPECHQPSPPLRRKHRSPRSQSGCEVVGCEGKYLAKGLCNKHYKRMAVYGDALAPVRYHAREGEPMAWIMAHKDSTATECLTWPFAKSKEGYGKIRIEGKGVLTHRLMCEHRHGPPPTPRHEAAHICGKGHLSCVNPNHLAWKTPVENCADRVVHGTHPRGESHPLARLREEDIVNIRASRAFQSVLADRYGVTQSHISAIKMGKMWGWLHV